MDMIEIIAKKRDGHELTGEQIRYFVRGFTDGSIPDYQASALLMAIYLNGLTDEETYCLSDEMLHSGELMDLSGIEGQKVDKHSTGGVGDKITLITGPIAAACGVKVAKMSGRGLAYTGGTIDKLEAIPGFRTSLTTEEFFKQVNEIGLAVVSQTLDVAPADKKIYALRDVTATVGNRSLIASSIMSKKLASGADAIVLDVKCGSGALMKTEEEAADLAEIMMKIGNHAGKRMTAVISDMNQPLGNAVGNTLEVIEAIEVLRGRGPADITQLATELAAHMVHAGGVEPTIESARERARNALADGSALEKMREMIRYQGGDERVLEDYSIMPGSTLSVDVVAPREGYIVAINTQAVGQASQHAGAGRLSKTDVLDMGAGIHVHKKIGDHVSAGDVLMTIVGNDAAKLQAGLKYGLSAYVIGDASPWSPSLIHRIMTK
ncbi:MAG: thymidine phosphorylase [Mogibacterium sp.]|nr:thymidine phosphorylase [Mogibacterium sp.]